LEGKSGGNNEAVSASKAKSKFFSKKEFLDGLGVMIAATELVERGCDIFSVKD
jgi:hypothetical protein